MRYSPPIVNGDRWQLLRLGHLLFQLDRRLRGSPHHTGRVTEVVSVLLNPPSFPMAVGEVMRPNVLPRNAEGRVIVGRSGDLGELRLRASYVVDSLGLVRGGMVRVKAQELRRTSAAPSRFTDVTESRLPPQASQREQELRSFRLTGTIWCWGRGGRTASWATGSGYDHAPPVLGFASNSTSRWRPYRAGCQPQLQRYLLAGLGTAGGWGLGGQIGNGSTGTQVAAGQDFEFGLSGTFVVGGWAPHLIGINIEPVRLRCCGMGGPRAARQRRDGGCQHTHSPSREYPLRAARRMCGLGTPADIRPRRGQAYCWGDNRQGAASGDWDAHHSHRSDSRTDGTSFFLHFRRLPGTRARSSRWMG